jgi:cell division septal protein FtsQ
MKLFRKSAPKLGRQRAGARQQSTSAYSYYAQRSDQELNTGRQLDRSALQAKAGHFRNFWLQRFGLVVLLLAVIASAANVLSLSSDAKIVPLTSSTSQTFLQDQADYQTAANKLFAGSIWNRNKITVDTAHISAQLVKQFPELSSVSITLPLLAHRPLVYIQPVQPALILAATNGSFVLDTEGKALLSVTNSASLASLDLPVVTDQSGIKVSINHQALTSGDVGFIQTIIAELAAKHISVSAMTLPAAASELDAQISGQPYFVKFNLESGDARQQAGTFLATQAHLQSQNITPTKYIDVRVDGRAYYQ